MNPFHKRTIGRYTSDGQGHHAWMELEPAPDRRKRQPGTILLCCAALAQGSSLVAQPRPEEPETVMITLHAKAGAEAELAQVIARHWDTARRLKMLRETPHLTLRSAEGAQTDFVEIMTWRDASVPDSAPAEASAAQACGERADYPATCPVSSARVKGPASEPALPDGEARAQLP